MKNLENLSKKLDTKIAEMKAKNKLDEFINNEAQYSGLWGGFEGLFKGVFFGFILGGIIGIWSNGFGVLIFFLSVIIGIYSGYHESFSNKKSRLERENRQ
jgi:hypothetical protein